MALRPVRPREGDLWGRQARGRRLGRSTAGAGAGGAGRSARRSCGARALPADRVGTDDSAARGGGLAGALRAGRGGGVPYQQASSTRRWRRGLALGWCCFPATSATRIRGSCGRCRSRWRRVAGELWIVTHADLKATARVRAFFEAVGEGLARECDLFEGDASGRATALGPRGVGERELRRQMQPLVVAQSSIRPLAGRRVRLPGGAERLVTLADFGGFRAPIC